VVTVLTAKREAEEMLLSVPGVTGVGVNWERNTIRVYMERFDEELDQTIPYWISGFEVEVIVTGKFISRLDSASGDVLTTLYRRLRWRPYYGGMSAGHYAMSAGTAGAVVRDLESGEKVLLSNNHVFANVATDRNEGGHIGDAILQPAAWDGGVPADVVATLHRFVPMIEDGDNIIDAAIARPVDPDEVEEYVMGEILPDRVSARGIGVRGMATVTDSAFCKKFGRTTGHTTGYVIDSEFTTNVGYGMEHPVRFVDQLLMAMRVEGGDSGSLVLDEQDRAIGLVVAAAQTGDVTYSVANKIRNVATVLDIDIPEAEEDVTIRVFDTPPEEDPTVVASKIPAFGWIAIGAVAGMIIFGGRKHGHRDDSNDRKG